MHTLTWNMILFAEMQLRNTFFIEPQIKSRLLSFAFPYSTVPVHSVCFGYMRGANKLRN